jgi:hypothetical protein
MYTSSEKGRTCFGVLLVLFDFFIRASSLSPSDVFRSRPSLTYYSSIGCQGLPSLRRLHTRLLSTSVSSNTQQASPKNKKTRTWDESLELLNQYKETYGNCSVPNRWKDDRSLANWVGNQRKFHVTMSEVRRAALDAVGFDWNPLETYWNEMFHRLVIYKAERKLQRA